MQNVAAAEKPQLTVSAAIAVVSDSQPLYSTVSSITAVVGDVMNESSALNVSDSPPVADTAEPEPPVPNDTDHGQNCTTVGTFMDSWLFPYNLYAFCICLACTTTAFPFKSSYLVISFFADVMAMNHMTGTQTQFYT